MRLAIRKVQFAPDKKGPQPRAEAKKQFLMSDKCLCVEATLDKDVSITKVIHSITYDIILIVQGREGLLFLLGQ